MAGKKIFTDHEYQTSAHLVTPKVHSVANISSHAGVLGQLAASGNNLYFHDGSNWFSLIESNYAGALTGRPNFDPASGNIPFTVGAGHTDRVDNLNADLLDGYDTSTNSAVASKIPVYGSSGVLKVGTPSDDLDAANKLYVDSAIEGLDIKASVAAASTGNLTLSGTQTIDGTSITAGMRVLVKDQSVASQNGIYICQSGSWALAEDSDSGSLSEGAYVFVEAGTVNNNTGWTYTDSSAYTWAQFSGAGQLNAGNGLVKSGDTLNANVAAPISIVSDQITIADGAITGSKLANNTVTSTQLADSIQVSDLAISGDSAYMLTVDRTSSSGTWAAFGNSTTGSAGDNGLIVGVGSDESAYFWHKENEKIHIGTNSASAIDIEADNDVKVFNDLGIATSPSHRFHVKDNTDTGNGGIAIERSSTGDKGFLNMRGGRLGLVTETALPIKFYTDDTERMEITPGGGIKIINKLGIGVTPSSYHLQVASGNKLLAGGYTFLERTPTSENNNVLYVQSTGLANNQALAKFTYGATAGGANTGNETFVVARTASYFNSKLGIGVSPDTALDIQGNNNISSRIKITNTAPSTNNVWNIHANYSDQTLQFMGDSTLALKLDDSGQVTVGTLPTSTADNSLIVESSGLLKKRTANSGIWTTNLGANRLLVSNNSGVITSDSRFIHLGGRVSLTGAIDSSANLKVDIVDHNVTTNDTNHEKAIFAYAGGGYNIASGVTDSGYRIAVDASAFVSDSDFEGTLNYQYGVLARHGAYVSASGSTITNSYGVYIDSLTNSNTTITNLYGLYQEDSAARNYFAGSLGIGATPDSTYKLIVNGKSKLQNDIVFSSANPRIDFASTSSGIRLYSTTSNAEKLRLTDSGLKLADISTSTTDTNVIVESSGLLKKRALNNVAFAGFGSGTVGKIPIWSGNTTTLGDSLMSQSGTILSLTGASTRLKLTDGTNQINFGLWDGTNYRLEGDANRKILITSYHTDGIHLGGSGASDLVVKGNKVGIGTDSPKSLLELSGSNPVLNFYNSAGGTDQKYFYIQNVSGKLQISKANDAYNSFDQLVTVLNSGNVGIGISTNISAKLHVIGDIASSTRVAVDTVNGYTGGSTPLTIQTGGNQELKLGTNATNAITVDTSQNVGIGVDDPSAGFHVVNATEPTVLFESTNAGSSGSRLQLYHNSATPADNDILSNIQIAGKDSGGNKRYAALIQTVAADVNASSVDGDIRFVTYKSNTGSEVMRITHDEKVGIGNSPTYKLDIGGSTSSTSNTLRIHQANGGTAIRVGVGSGGSDVTLMRVDGSNGNNAGASNSGNVGFSLKYKGTGDGNTNALSIFSDNVSAASQVEALTVLQDGSIGINCTPNTSYKLDVDGAGRFTTSLRSDGYLTIASDTAEFYIANAAISKFWRQRLSANGTEYNLLFDYNDGTGNITPLTLSNTGHATFSGTITSTDNANGSGDNIVVSTTNKDAGLYAISSKRSGTTVGGMRIDGRFRAADGSATSPAYAFTNDTNTGMFRAGSDHLQFVTGGTSRLEITNAGAVKATRDGGSNSIQVARIHDGSLTGNGSATSFTVTHNLETAKPIAVVIDHTSGAYVEAQIVVDSDNAIIVTFNNPPSSGKVYRVPVTG